MMTYSQATHDKPEASLCEPGEVIHRNGTRCGTQLDARVCLLHSRNTLMNPLALISAAVANLAVTMILYAPSVMGDTWKKLARNDKHAKKDRKMLVAYLVQFVTSLALAWLLGRAALETSTMYQMLITIWVIFSVLLRLPSYLFEGRPLKLFGLYAFHDLLSLMIIGTVVTLWK